MVNQTAPYGDDLADSEAMLRIQAHDERAFELLFERYRDPLSRYVCGIVRGEVDTQAIAQDLVQESFLRVWMRAEQWNGQGSPKSWLYQIATNLALNHLRERNRHPAQPLANE